MATKVIVYGPATKLIETQPPRWNALFQVDRVPPWKVFTESVMNTCDRCHLNSAAGPENCRLCPLVEFVQTTLTAVNINTNNRKQYAPIKQ